LLALGFAVGLNVDSVLIVKRLSRDSALRKSVVAEAESFAKSPPVEINNVPTRATAQQGTRAATSTPAGGDNENTAAGAAVASAPAGGGNTSQGGPPAASAPAEATNPAAS